MIGLLIGLGALQFSQQSATVEGVLTIPGGNQPIDGVRVTFISARGSEFIVTTGMDGTFIAKDLPPGPYAIRFSRDGFMKPRRNAGPETLTLAPSEHYRKLRLQLIPTSVIAGSVSDDHGRPRVRMRVQAMQYRYLDGRRELVTVKTALTDDQGLFRIFGLEPGDYLLRAGERPVASTFYPAGPDPQFATTLTLNPGSEIVGLSFSVANQPTFTIRLRISPTGADVLPQVYVVPRYSGDPPGGPTPLRSLSNETYAVSGFYPGSYDLYASVVVRPGSTDLRLFGRTSVEITDKDVEVPAINLEQEIDIAGTVVGLDSTVAYGWGKIRLTFRPLDDMVGVFLPQTTELSRDNTFVVSHLDPGRYQISLDGLPPDFFVASIRYGETELSDNQLIVNSEKQQPLNVRVAGSGGRINGLLKNHRDEPVPEGRVVLVPVSSRRKNLDAFKMVLTDLNGGFIIQGIPPGDYGLLAWEDVSDGAYSHPEFLLPFESRLVSIKVVQNSAQSVELRVIQGK